MLEILGPDSHPSISAPETLTLRLHTSEIMQYLLFWICLISLTIHPFGAVTIFPRPLKFHCICFRVCAFSLFWDPMIDPIPWRLWILLWRSWARVFSVLLPVLCIYTCGLPGLHGSLIFGILKSFHTVFHKGCTNLHSSQQGSLFSASSPAPGIFCLLMIIAIWTGVMLSHCSSLENGSAECFSMHLLAICVSDPWPICKFSYLFSHSVAVCAPYIFYILTC